MFQVPSGATVCFRARGHSLQGTCCPVVFSESSLTNFTIGLTSLPVRRRQRENAGRRHVSSSKHHLHSDLEAKAEWATQFHAFGLKREALCSLPRSKCSMSQRSGGRTCRSFPPQSLPGGLSLLSASPPSRCLCTEELEVTPRAALERRGS